MLKLIKLIESLGHTFVGVLHLNGFYTFYAHDPQKAGNKPVLEFCRDEIDYRYMMDAWWKRGTYILFSDENFSKALSGAIESIKS